MCDSKSRKLQRLEQNKKIFKIVENIKFIFYLLKPPTCCLIASQYSKSVVIFLNTLWTFIPYICKFALYIEHCDDAFIGY